MKNILIILAELIFFALLTGSVLSQGNTVLPSVKAETSPKQFHHAINSCPGGLAFGVYSVNYEYMVGKNHGLVGRFDLETISESYSVGSVDANSFGFILNYRYHCSGALKSTFFGTYARYRYFTGDGKSGSEKFDFTTPELTLGLNIGKRWVWNSGFNMVFQFGYGVSWHETDTNHSSPAIKSTMKKFEDEYEFFGPFLGELSIGYAF